ncbi:hypothetical protein [Actinomadura geliboluensis]|uniref:hypothetical protein n=1 Tax=Actinomadura geliboluensis TaxID=882440 RepID=UPI0037211B53
MRKRARRLLAAITAASAIVSLVASPASAASWTVSPGGFFTGVGPVQLANLRTGFVIACTSTILGNASGFGPLFRLTSVTFSGCVANYPIPVTVTAPYTGPANPWTFAVTGVTSGGVTPGRLNGIEIQLDVPSAGCSAEVAGAGGLPGYVEGHHTNPANPGDPSTLSIPILGAGNLAVTTLWSPCPTLVSSMGDEFAINAAYELSPGQTVS